MKVEHVINGKKVTLEPMDEPGSYKHTIEGDEGSPYVENIATAMDEKFEPTALNLAHMLVDYMYNDIDGMSLKANVAQLRDYFDFFRSIGAK